MRLFTRRRRSTTPDPQTRGTPSSVLRTSRMLYPHEFKSHGVPTFESASTVASPAGHAGAAAADEPGSTTPLPWVENKWVRKCKCLPTSRSPRPKNRKRTAPTTALPCLTTRLHSTKTTSSTLTSTAQLWLSPPKVKTRRDKRERMYAAIRHSDHSSHN